MPPHQWALLKSQQSASHVCVHLGPAVIADCPPLSPVVYLQAAFVATSPSGKSDDAICDKKIKADTKQINFKE